jgi:hypothetical protein
MCTVEAYSLYASTVHMYCIYPGNSGDHKTSIMSIPDECYSRNGYPGNSGDHKTSIMSIPIL